MGLVLPAELLSVNYAAQVRRFLLESFASVELVLFSERVFPGVQEEVVLLLAEGYRQGPTDHASIYQVRNAAELSTTAAGRTWRPARPEDKWTPSLLPADALSAYTALSSARGVHGAGDVGRHHPRDGHRQQQVLRPVPGTRRRAGADDRRTCCGCPRPAAATCAGSPSAPPPSRSLASKARRRGCSARTASPRPPPGRTSPPGRRRTCTTAYKCRVRTPWWRVPLRAAGGPAADLHERRHPAAVHQRRPGGAPELGARGLPAPRRARTRYGPAAAGVADAR